MRGEEGREGLRLWVRERGRRIEVVVGGWVGGEGGRAEDVIKTGEERGRQMGGWRVEREGVQKEQRKRVVSIGHCFQVLCWTVFMLCRSPISQRGAAELLEDDWGAGRSNQAWIP